MKKIIKDLPSSDEFKYLLEREKNKIKYFKLLKNTISSFIVILAFSFLISTFIFPALKISGNSMGPTLKNNEIVFGIKTSNIKRGDIIGFYYNNRILIKRVIAVSGEWVNMDNEGNVFVDDKLLEEDYVLEKSLGDIDIEFPYQVPENSYFVLGDNRVSSIDSRNSLIGTISNEEIIGKIIIKVWPIKNISFF